MHRVRVGIAWLAGASLLACDEGDSVCPAVAYLGVSIELPGGASLPTPAQPDGACRVTAKVKLGGVTMPMGCFPDDGSCYCVGGGGGEMEVEVYRGDTLVLSTPVYARSSPGEDGCGTVYSQTLTLNLSATDGG